MKVLPHKHISYPRVTRGGMASHRRHKHPAPPLISFSDIPLELRRIVNDRLHVVDRFNLNRALPRDQRIKRSDAEKKKDRQVAILWRLHQRGRLVAPLPIKVMHAMQEHAADSTIATIAADLGVTVCSDTTHAWDAFMAACMNGTVTLDDVARLSDAEVLSPKFAGEMGHVLSLHMSIPLYESVVLDRRIQRARLFTYSSSFVFDAISRLNFAFVEYMCARELHDPIAREALEYVRKSTIATILIRYDVGGTKKTSAIIAKFMLERLNLPEHTKSALLTEAINCMNEDIIVMMVDAGVA